MKNRPEFNVLLRELENRLQKSNMELEECPEGTLRKSISNGKAVFFQAKINTNGTVLRKSLYRKPETVKALARKAYLEAEVKVLEWNLEMLKQAMNNCELMQPEEIIKRLPGRYHGIPNEWFLDGIRHGHGHGHGHGHEQGQGPEPKHRSDWASEPYTKSDFRPEELTKITTRGLHVRSMAELAIAERFYYYQLIFRYEELIDIEGYRFAPDFTIMRRRDGKIFYWEHCGLPHDAEYMRRHKWKLSMYEKAGIVPWDNLIVTYGDRHANVDMRIAESEIVNKLL